MARYKDSLKNYREEKNRWDSLGKKRSETPEPEQPPLKMFLIAGDNSGTGILENLIEADGVGLICETEADTVSTAIGADHGHWSDTLRKCHTMSDWPSTGVLIMSTGNAMSLISAYC